LINFDIGGENSYLAILEKSQGAWANDKTWEKPLKEEGK